MTENRKASGQCLKAEILLGDSVEGSGRLIWSGGYREDVTKTTTLCFRDTPDRLETGRNLTRPGGFEEDQ